jgi:hypothetical protein
MRKSSTGDSNLLDNVTRPAVIVSTVSNYVLDRFQPHWNSVPCLARLSNRGSEILIPYLVVFREVIVIPIAKGISIDIKSSFQISCYSLLVNAMLAFAWNLDIAGS